MPVVPEAAIPTFILEFVQFTVTPVAVLKEMGCTVFPEQITCVLPGAVELIVIVGVGLTVTRTESFFTQPLAPVASSVYSVVVVGEAITGVP